MCVCVCKERLVFVPPVNAIRLSECVCEFRSKTCKHIRHNAQTDRTVCTGAWDSACYLCVLFVGPTYTLDSINTFSSYAKCTIHVNVLEIRMSAAFPVDIHIFRTTRKETKTDYILCQRCINAVCVRLGWYYIVFM